jgi:hypothetical protein
MDGQSEVEFLRSELGERGRWEDTGVVDQHIQSTEIVGNPLHGRTYGERIGTVSLDRQDPPARGAKRFDDLNGLRGPPHIGEPTSAPSFARRSTMARPIPRLPPVTSATFPGSDIEPLFQLSPTFRIARHRTNKPLMASQERYMSIITKKAAPWLSEVVHVPSTVRLSCGGPWWCSGGAATRVPR